MGKEGKMGFTQTELRLDPVKSVYVFKNIDSSL